MPSPAGHPVLSLALLIVAAPAHLKDRRSRRPRPTSPIVHSGKFPPAAQWPSCAVDRAEVQVRLGSAEGHGPPAGERIVKQAPGCLICRSSGVGRTMCAGWRRRRCLGFPYAVLKARALMEAIGNDGGSEGGGELIASAQTHHKATGGSMNDHELIMELLRATSAEGAAWAEAMEHRERLDDFDQPLLLVEFLPLALRRHQESTAEIAREEVARRVALGDPVVEPTSWGLRLGSRRDLWMLDLLVSGLRVLALRPWDYGNGKGRRLGLAPLSWTPF